MFAFSAIIYVLLAGSAFAVAFFGNRNGERGAVVATIGSWAFVILAGLNLITPTFLNSGTVALMIGLLTVAVLVTTFPMFLASNSRWLKGRFYIGLAVAVPVSLLFPMAGIYGSCAFFSECL